MMKAPKLLLAVVLLALAGCFNWRVAEKPHPSGHPISTADEAAVFTKLRALNDEIKSYRAVSDTRITYNQKVSRLRHAFVFRKPGMLRLETFPTNANYSLNLLIATPGKVTLLDPAERTAHMAESGADLIRSNFYIPADERDLMSLLSGRISEGMLNTVQSSTDHKLLTDETAGTIAVIKGDFEYYWELDASTLLLRRAQLRDKFSGKLNVDIAYGHYGDFGGIKVPTEISLDLPPESVNARFEIPAPKLNQDIPDLLFEAHVPSDYTVSGPR